jgi:hypothetical protein
MRQSQMDRAKAYKISGIEFPEAQASGDVAEEILEARGIVRVDDSAEYDQLRAGLMQHSILRMDDEHWQQGLPTGEGDERTTSGQQEAQNLYEQYARRPDSGGTPEGAPEAYKKTGDPFETVNVVALRQEEAAVRRAIFEEIEKERVKARDSGEAPIPTEEWERVAQERTSVEFEELCRQHLSELGVEDDDPNRNWYVAKLRELSIDLVDEQQWDKGIQQLDGSLVSAEQELEEFRKEIEANHTAAPSAASPDGGQPLNTETAPAHVDLRSPNVLPADELGSYNRDELLGFSRSIMDRYGLIVRRLNELLDEGVDRDINTEYLELEAYLSTLREADDRLGEELSARRAAVPLPSSPSPVPSPSGPSPASPSGERQGGHEDARASSLRAEIKQIEDSGELLDTRRRLADLTAEIMKGKRAGDDAEFLDAREAYSALVLRYNRMWIELARIELSLTEGERDSLSAEQREANEAQLKEQALAMVLDTQTELRQDVREAYLSNVWRKGVAKGAELWNHEDWKRRWATRLALGGAASAAMILFVPGGVGAGVFGLGLAGGAKGAAVGVASSFLRRSSKGPDASVEGDARTLRDSETADFSQKVDDILGKTSEASGEALLSDALAESKARRKARSIRNLGKGAVIGFGVGLGFGTLRNAAMFVMGDGVSGPGVKDFSDNMQNKPSMGAGDSPSPSPSGSDFSPSPSPETGVDPNLGTGNTDHNGLLPDGSRAQPQPSGPSGGERVPDLQPKSTNANPFESGPSSSQPEVPAAEVSGDRTLANSFLDQNAGETAEAARDIVLDEGPYQTFEALGIPRGQWDSLYNNEELITKLKDLGDAYSLDNQGHGFGWSHAGVLKDKSIIEIYRAAGMSPR